MYKLDTNMTEVRMPGPTNGSSRGLHTTTSPPGNVALKPFIREQSAEKGQGDTRNVSAAVVN